MGLTNSDSCDPANAAILQAERKLEARLAHDDGEQHLSPEAEEVDRHVRGVISDLTEHDVRRSPGKHASRLSRRLWIAALLFVALFILMGGVYIGVFVEDDSAGTAAATTTHTSEAPDDGSIAGTWEMLWTNSAGTQSVAFTLTITGDETGSVIVNNDASVEDGAFSVTGDEVTITFTRVFALDTGNWPEESTFIGQRADDGTIQGSWSRQGWSCDPQRSPACRYDTPTLQFDAVLIRP